MTSAEVEHWLATHTRSGDFSFTDVKLSWNEAQYLERFAEVHREDPRRRHLPAQPHVQGALQTRRLAADVLPRPAPEAARRLWRHRRHRRGDGAVGVAGAVHRAGRPHGVHAADEGNGAARRHAGSRRRGPQAVGRGRQAARREPDDRRPDAQRHRAHRRDRQRRRHRPVHRRDLQDAAPDDVRRARHAEEGRRHGGAAARHLPARLHCRRAQDPRHGADPPARDPSRAVSTAAPSATSRPTAASLFNVAIRTAVIFRNADGEMGIGSGVVFD